MDVCMDVWMFVGGISVHVLVTKCVDLCIYVCVFPSPSIERARSVCVANQNSVHLCHPTA